MSLVRKDKLQKADFLITGGLLPDPKEKCLSWTYTNVMAQWTRKRKNYMFASLGYNVKQFRAAINKRFQQ